jgi:hypothetical protein
VLRIIEEGFFVKGTKIFSDFISHSTLSSKGGKEIKRIRFRELIADSDALYSAAEIL